MWSINFGLGRRQTDFDFFLHLFFQRNRRMFGNLLGTLQKFKQDENRVKDREQKKRDIEKKIEEKTEKEKEEAKRTKNELFSEKKKQEHEIKILQVNNLRYQTRTISKPCF